MTRTGTLAFSRCALLAMLVGSDGRRPGSKLDAILGEPTAVRTADDVADSPTQSADGPPRRIADIASWQPTRTSIRTPRRAQPKTRHPTQQVGGAGAPKPFVPPADAEAACTGAQANSPTGRSPQCRPTDAEQLVAAQRAPGTIAARRADRDAIGRREQSPDFGRADVAVRRSNNSTPARHANCAAVHRATASDRPRRSPRPTRPTADRLFDDSWIRPLKQVAYQAGEPEELYAPPGDESAECMRPAVPRSGSEMQSDGEWIGSPEGGPYGGPCCDGECGPDCGCARLRRRRGHAAVDLRLRVGCLLR